MGKRNGYVNGEQLPINSPVLLTNDVFYRSTGTGYIGLQYARTIGCRVDVIVGGYFEGFAIRFGWA